MSESRSKTVEAWRAGTTNKAPRSYWRRFTKDATVSVRLTKAQDRVPARYSQNPHESRDSPNVANGAASSISTPGLSDVCALCSLRCRFLERIIVGTYQGSSRRKPQ